MNIKLFLILILLLSALVFWLLPKTKFARYLKMNEKLFYTMNIIGIVSGVAGLVAAIGWGEVILTGHYFEIILLPAFLIYLYSALIMQVQGSDNLYDEKQNYDMTRAAAMSLPYSIGAMFFLYAMYKEGIFEGLVWFPIFVFFSLTVYSASTLYYFRKD